MGIEITQMGRQPVGVTLAEFDFIEKCMKKEESAWKRKTKVTLKKGNQTTVIKRTGPRSFTVNGRSRTGRTAKAAAKKFGNAIANKLRAGWSWGKFKSPRSMRQTSSKKKTPRKKAKKKAKKKKTPKKKTKKTSGKKTYKCKVCKKNIRQKRGRGRPRRTHAGCK